MLKHSCKIKCWHKSDQSIACECAVNAHTTYLITVTFPQNAYRFGYCVILVMSWANRMANKSYGHMEWSSFWLFAGSVLTQFFVVSFRNGLLFSRDNPLLYWIYIQIYTTNSSLHNFAYHSNWHIETILMGIGKSFSSVNKLLNNSSDFDNLWIETAELY